MACIILEKLCNDANDEVVFHSIIVITDRKVLDKQLQRDIFNMEHKAGVVIMRVDKTQGSLPQRWKEKELSVHYRSSLSLIFKSAAATAGKLPLQLS